MPEISVVVPVYGVEEYLSDCIESILGQSFSDFELILVDDGSPDRCGELCEQYASKDPRIRVIHQENRGLSGARNSGIDIASGTYITFVDSDDVLAANYLSTLYRTILAENAQIATAINYDVSSDRISTAARTEATDPTVVQVMDGQTAVLRVYKGEKLVQICAIGKLIDRSLIQELRFPQGRIHEDQALIPLLYDRARRVVCTNASIYFYRVRNDSILHKTFSMKRYDDIWAIDQCISYFQAQGKAEIVEAAREKRYRILCCYALLAKEDHLTPPQEYQIPTGKALRYLRKTVSDEKYSYYLSKVHPGLVRPHSYLVKLGKMLQFKKR